MVMATDSLACFRRRCALISRCTSSFTRRSRLLIGGFSISGVRALPAGENPQSNLKRSAHLLDFEALDPVSRLVTVKTIEPDTAFQAGAHLVGVVLEAAQGADLALED